MYTIVYDLYYLYTIMSITDTLSVRVDAKLKKDASKLADKLGVSLGTVFTVYLKQFLREKRLVIEEYDDTEWTQELEKKYLAAKADYKAWKNVKTLSFAKK